jgi:hypothetical protein
VFNGIDCQFTHGSAPGISITVDAAADTIFASGFDTR